MTANKENSSFVIMPANTSLEGIHENSNKSIGEATLIALIQKPHEN